MIRFRALSLLAALATATLATTSTPSTAEAAPRHKRVAVVYRLTMNWQNGATGKPYSTNWDYSEKYEWNGRGWTFRGYYGVDRLQYHISLMQRHRWRFLNYRRTFVRYGIWY